MLYFIRGFESPEALPLRLQARPAHVARLHALREAGRLVLAGPLPAMDSPEPGPAGFVGSVVVAEFDSLEAAEAWAKAEPYWLAGAWSRVEVQPFVKVLP